MNKFLYFIMMIIISYGVFSQESVHRSLPDISLKNLNGENMVVSAITNYDHPVLLCFWKTCCSSPNKMMDVLYENYEDWKEEFGLEIIVISADDFRSSNRVKPFVNAKGWEFEVLLDVNCDLKRAMNVYAVPHLFLLNQNGHVVWQKAAFMDGDENIIYEEIIKLNETKTISQDSVLEKKKK